MAVRLEQAPAAQPAQAPALQGAPAEFPDDLQGPANDAIRMASQVATNMGVSALKSVATASGCASAGPVLDAARPVIAHVSETASRALMSSPLVGRIVGRNQQ